MNNILGIMQHTHGFINKTSSMFLIHPFLSKNYLNFKHPDLNQYPSSAVCFVPLLACGDIFLLKPSGLNSVYPFYWSGPKLLRSFPEPDAPGLIQVLVGVVEPVLHVTKQVLAPCLQFHHPGYSVLYGKIWHITINRLYIMVLITPNTKKNVCILF